MVKLKNIVTEIQERNEIREGLIIWSELLAQDDNLNEENLPIVTEGINDILTKIGLEIKKEPGLIEYFYKFSKGIGKVIFYLLQGKMDKVKAEIGKFTKEEFLDFLYKLDVFAFHIVTEKLHLIDALTGWDLVANIESKVKSATIVFAKIKDELSRLAMEIKNYVESPYKKLALLHLQNLEKVIFLKDKNA